MLFESENVALRAAINFRSRTCVVTFSERSEDQKLDRPGFGEDLIRRIECDAFFVTCRANNWYQYQEMPEVIGLLKERLSAYDDTVTYGSSMGAYAAIQYGGQIGANRAIAISPQFSVDPTKVPWERRWSRDAERIIFVDDDICGSLTDKTHVFVLVDPCHPDMRHARLIEADSPRCTLVRMPLASHPVGHFLRETNLLKPVASELLLGNFKGHEWPARRRKARAVSASYWRGIAECAMRTNRRSLAVQACNEALRINPSDERAQLIAAQLRSGLVT